MNNYKKTSKWMSIAVFSALSIHSIAQSSHKESVPLPTNAALELQWQHADITNDGLVGVSATKTYNELVKGKTPTPVVVAVIDSGTETFHPDLKANIWVNADEIAGNGIDDDKNGYIDDVHGWSFIGGKNGDVSADNLEFTRVYKVLKAKYENKSADAIAKSDKKEYEKYLKFKDDYQKRLEEAQQGQQQYAQFFQLYKLADQMAKTKLGKDTYTLEEVQGLQTEDEMSDQMKQILIVVIENNIVEQFPDWQKQVENTINYSYNLEFDPRSIVGDNYSDPNERIYGNNHVDGPEAEHGTHVAGIIGAQRGNGGMDGLCASAQLMIIRCVPNGDERDKDVANAIRYATDNGARVINMSFGKSNSPYKEVVDEAVKYAEAHNVLLIHAAGNDAKNLDKASNFPTKKYLKGGECKSWLEIGASGNKVDHLAADFSNYGKKSVDVFAPGVDIYSTMTNDSFKKESGTSMASPVTAGVAAAIIAYYPALTAVDVKNIIMKSAVSYKKNFVPMPGDGGMNEKPQDIEFSKLSKSGAVVNMYEAMKLAATWKPSKLKK
jgi:subtilisin family serine protease